MSIIIKQGCNKPQIWNITELVNIEQLTKVDNERGKRLDLRWWSNYVEVSVELVISGLQNSSPNILGTKYSQPHCHIALI